MASSSSTRKAAPAGLRLPLQQQQQRAKDDSGGGGGWPGGLTVDTGHRPQGSDPSPSSIYSSSPSASTSSQISRNHSFSLDYYALPSPAPQSPSATGAYPLPQPPRSYSTSSSYSNYSQGDDEMGGPPKPAFLGGHPRRVSSRGSLGQQGGGQPSPGAPPGGLPSPGPGGEIVLGSPPPLPPSPGGSRKSSWGDTARRSPLGGFLALRKGSAGRSPKGADLPDPGVVRRKSSAASDSWALPNRPPPTPPNEPHDEAKDEEVLDISWARKMVEEMEADTDGSDSDGSRRGSASTKGIPEIGLGVGLDESQYSDDSFYRGGGGAKGYDRPRAEDLGFSPNSTTFNLSSGSDCSLPSPGSEAPPPASNQTTPRQPQHASSQRSPLGVAPSLSRSSSPLNGTSPTSAPQPRPELPHSSSLEQTNRRIHVIEASPTPSPTSARPINMPDSLYPVTSRSSAGSAGWPHMSTSPAGSGTSSQNAATGHSPLLSGSGRAGFSPDPAAHRRSSERERALAFVVPPGGSERSIGQLADEVRLGAGEIVRLDNDDDYAPAEHQFGEDARRPSLRTRQAAEWNAALEDYKEALSEEDDGEGHEPGYESPALLVARERAARARTVHLASIQVTQATSPTTLSPQSSPSLAAYSFSEEQAKRARNDSGPQVEPPHAEGKSLLLTVERPKRSAMRPMRTPSPAPSTESAAHPDEPVEPLQISPKRMSAPSHAKQSSTSTIRAFSASPRRRSTITAESPRRPSSSLELPTEPLEVMKQAREGSTSTTSSRKHARTLEELTAVLDLAINDSELDSNLALDPNYGSPIRTTYGQPSDDGTVSPTSRSPTRSRSPLPPSIVEAPPATPSPTMPAEPGGGGGGRLSVTEDKPKPRRMSKETDAKSRSAAAPGPATAVRTRASDDAQARLSISSQRSSASGPVVRKTSSMASLGLPMGGHPQQGRQPLYSNTTANAQASRASLADSNYSPTAASFAKTGKWPRAMVYSDVKGLRSPGERAVAYARKINELQQSETGLADWLRWKAGGGESTRAAPRRNSPSLLGTIVEPSSRNVSSSSHFSTGSEDFPMRGGPTLQATQMRNVSPPSGPPPNLPYPQLAPGIGTIRPSPSSGSMRTIGPGYGGGRPGEHALISSRPSISSSIASVASNPGGFLSALGRRGSASASQTVKFKGRSPPLGLASLPSSAGGGGGAPHQLSPRKGSIRGIEISSPSAFSKGSGQIDGNSSPGRVGLNGPSGPRAPSHSFGTASPLGLERMSLDSSSGSSHGPQQQQPAAPPPTQYSAPTSAPTAAAPAPAAPSATQSPELKEMVEILDADPRLLSKYLEQANNNPTAAIGQFLVDQSRGTLLHV